MEKCGRIFVCDNSNNVISYLVGFYIRRPYLKSWIRRGSWIKTLLVLKLNMFWRLLFVCEDNNDFQSITYNREIGYFCDKSYLLIIVIKICNFNHLYLFWTCHIYGEGELGFQNLCTIRFCKRFCYKMCSNYLFRSVNNTRWSRINSISVPGRGT